MKLALATAAVVLALWPLAPAGEVATLSYDSQQAQFRTRSEIVQVYATASGRNGAAVTDLRGDEFEVYEDGKRRDIAVFSALVQPLSVAIILDHSGSTAQEFAQVIQAAGSFIGRLFKEDRARVDTLGWDCVPFTADRATMIAGLQRDLPRDPGSPIWSATDRAMAALSTEPGRRVILLLSDGIDNQPELLDIPPARGKPLATPAPHGCTPADFSKLVILKDVMDRAERDEVMVYAVAVPSADPGNGGVAFNSGSTVSGTPMSTAPPLMERDPHQDLHKLTKRSGGSVQQLTNYSELAAAFKVIADELHLQDLLGFVPTAHDGRRHDITVKVTRPGVSVRARETYIAQTK